MEKLLEAYANDDFTTAELDANLVMDNFLEAYTNDDPTTAGVAALLCHRDVMRDVRSHAPGELQILDVATLGTEEM
jgi:hypothetical protein